jgi:hypothetical protein
VIDTSKAKWDLSKEDAYIFDWLQANGYDAVLEKQYVSKMKVKVTKDGVTDLAEFPSGKRYNVQAYMEQYGRAFELLRTIHQMEGGKQNGRD